MSAFFFSSLLCKLERREAVRNKNGSFYLYGSFMMNRFFFFFLGKGGCLRWSKRFVVPRVPGFSLSLTVPGPFFFRVRRSRCGEPINEPRFVLYYIRYIILLSSAVAIFPPFNFLFGVHSFGRSNCGLPSPTAMASTRLKPHTHTHKDINDHSRWSHFPSRNETK